MAETTSVQQLVRVTIGPFIERIASEAAIDYFGSHPRQIHPHEFLKPLRDRYLDVFDLKLDKRSRRMETVVPDRLLLRRKLDVMF